MLTANYAVPMVGLLMIYHSDLFYFWSVDTCFHVSYHNVYTSLADEDECTDNNDNCNENAECTNVPGSFECTCHDGFTGDGVHCDGAYTER